MKGLRGLSGFNPFRTIEAIEDADVLVVSTPELDDLVRLSDSYGRQGTTAH